MSNSWWKSPVLQGPENDYGDYDYLIEDIPSNTAGWEFSKYKWKCDDCNKERHLLFCMTDYFHTLDGYDCNSYSTCWKCYIKDRISSLKHRVIREIKYRKAAFEFAAESYKHDFKKRGFKFWYNLARKEQKRRSA